MIQPPGRSYWVFSGERNDAYMNQFNPLISMCWRANTDVSPCTGVEAVINYTAKYCSKIETQTSTYAQVARGILPYVSEGNSLLSFVSKMMNKLIGERDYSAQEVSHILLGLPLQEDSRVVQSVDCRPQDRHTYPLDLAEDGTTRDNKSAYDKYLERLEGLEGISYFEFLQRYNFASRNPAQWKEFRYPAKPRVLLYFPRYKAKPGHEQFENFCRVKLMLNHPHRRHEELKAYDHRHFSSYVEAYWYCVGNHEHPDDHYGMVDEPEVQPDDEEFVSEPFQEELTLEDWQVIARMLPDVPPEDEPVDLLTRRDIDLNYDWSPHVGRYNHNGFENGRYWDDLKANSVLDPTSETIPWSESQSLNPEQWAVYNTFMVHHRSGDRSPLRVQVDGGGGTGKSYLVKILSAHLHQQAADLANRPLAQVKSPILRAAPTGVASNQIHGQTLHSLFRLPVDRNFQPLRHQPAILSSIQRVFLGINYLVIDEKSMLGLKTLGWIDRRLREIFPERQDEFFGGISVIMIGDFFQLPPVLQKPLYADPGSSFSEDELNGLIAYRSFDRSVFLSTIQRQAGDDQAAFRQALLELRECRVSEESWALLSSRCAVRLSLTERDGFRSVIRIYTKKADVTQYNHAHMINLHSPAIYVSAINEGTGAERAESREAGNLSNRFPICVGCRVMLTRNLWTEAGLVNGAQGRVFDISWAEGANPERNDDPPRVILVVFDKYTGPPFILGNGDPCRDGEGNLAVPILQVRQDFTFRYNTCSRKQFPLVVSYAITVHKSQSLTLSKAVCDISEPEFASGLSYVAVSRVSRLEGLVFDNTFPRSRVFRDPPSRTMQLRINDYARRQGALLSQERHPLPPEYSDEESE